MAAKKALIVEDDKEDQKKIQGLLDSRGIEQTTVDTALAAHAKLKQKDYFFVVLDLDLGSGTDEGKFLLDTMLQEHIERPTIIISHAGLLPETIALKGRYSFVKETIDKKHLHTLLSVFDKAIKEFPSEAASSSERRSLTKRSLWPDLLPMLFAFVVVLGVVAAVSRVVSILIVGVVLIASLLVFLTIGILLWRRHDELSESTMAKLIDSIISSLPLLRKTGRSK
jgi:DNA-binding NtrC family response regulator